MGFADYPDYCLFLHLPMGLYLCVDTLLMIDSIHSGKSKLGNFKIPYLGFAEKVLSLGLGVRSQESGGELNTFFHLWLPTKVQGFSYSRADNESTYRLFYEPQTFDLSGFWVYSASPT